MAESGVLAESCGSFGSIPAPSPMSLAARGADLLGGTLSAARAIAGGDLAEVLRIELTDGRTAVVKSGPDPAVEAGMLEAMRAAGVPTPAVLAHDETTLVLELLPGGGDLGGAWADLGRVLARLHAWRGPRYGWDADYAFGGVAIANDWADDWPEFWRERRLASQIRHLPSALGRRIETLMIDLPDRLPATPPRSLLHGDLWTGNVLAARNRVTGLIDPACYFGDREVDFAMLALFAQPAPALLDAAGRLEPGSEERLPIYQLWPALVHVRLFGSAYLPLAERLLSSLGV
jgi:fructosamine-3-kinase